MNSVYGKSNDLYSFLYDPFYTMCITVNGQLLLTLLIEDLTLAIPNLQMLQVNTDGITIRLPRDCEETYNNVCKEWEKITKLTLEFVDYKSMIIQDVNNYIAIKLNGECKYKGLFEIVKDFHKDTSFKIITIALSEYFTKGVPILTTIKTHKNIYDFCGRAKFKSDSYGQLRSIGRDYTNNPIEVREKQQKTTRYYISNKGGTLIKVYPEKNKESFINKGYQVTIFNKYKEQSNYDINYKFYEVECQKILDSIECKQLELF